MDELSRLLGRVTAGIRPEYIRLPIDGGPAVYRERVYCYELYHQMRLEWPDDGPFRLNGEVDKAGHPRLGPLGASRYKPDLLVHGPGNMGFNHAVIEVKSMMANATGIKKDLNTLRLFRRVVGYERSISLIYGEPPMDRVIERVNNAAVGLPELPHIEVWVHCGLGEPAEHLFSLGRP
ncbi:methionyl-tRNA formyltransferase-like protein [Bradyrhizobium sp. Pear77]|uniref:methionyl-tRNA formyltransferase-like protein n=1 Tax=Bradyrhizobium altum TaxID=1571202 RepID=UPI001E3E2190|nr:methionyl-tRNA formyltransferase-like protein [Bradyrhizobium altum]MCC8952716.1 methionyl-tRNA formyltransferase-like protein [Bradyrhizobium altum]